MEANSLRFKSHSRNREVIFEEAKWEEIIKEEEDEAVVDTQEGVDQAVKVPMTTTTTMMKGT